MAFKRLKIGAAVAAAAIAPQSASAIEVAEQTQASALRSCLAAKVSADDKLATLRWMIGGLASTPQVRDFVKVDQLAKVEADKRLARILTRLVTVDCLAQARPLILDRPAGSFDVFWEALGELGAEQLMETTDAWEALHATVKYLNEVEFQRAIK